MSLCTERCPSQCTPHSTYLGRSILVEVLTACLSWVQDKANSSLHLTYLYPLPYLIKSHFEITLEYKILLWKFMRILNDPALIYVY